MRASLLASIALLAGGCGMPRDPEGTLARVRGGTLRVGVSVRAPWARLENGRPAGVEPALVGELAQELGATTEWTVGSESELLTALERHELDAVAGGLTEDTPWKNRVGLTARYLTTELVVGTAGQPPVESVRGREVGVRRGRPAAAARVRAAGGTPVWADDLTSHSGPVAAGRWELEALGLTPGGEPLHRDGHVVAVPPGENAWLLYLEKYLLAREARARELLRGEARR
jgi:polar amino acid transport system substrate-binding protein